MPRNNTPPPPTTCQDCPFQALACDLAELLAHHGPLDELAGEPHRHGKLSTAAVSRRGTKEIGRASCRERV